MKKFFAKYLLYIYTNFIIDNDLDTYKKWALPIIKSAIFVRSIIIWFASILFFPIFVIGMKIEEINKK